MVNYPDISSFGNGNVTIGDFLALPNSAFPYFWGIIFFGIWAIITITSYFYEKERIGRGNILSSFAVAGFAVILLAVLGTIIGFVSLEVMVITLCFGITFIAIWFFSS